MIPLLHTVTFFIALTLIFGVGFVLWRSVFSTSTSALQLETILFSCALGLTFLDFSMILMGKIGLPLNGSTVGISLLCAIGAGLAWKYTRQPQPRFLETRLILPCMHSRRTRIAFLLLFMLTLGIKTVYLSNAIVPTATDLGHHLYWAKTIVTTHALPVYQERAVIEQASSDENHPNVTIAPPTPIADFIIGEHLPMAALALLTGTSFFTAFPIVFLLCINLLGLLALVALSYRLAEHATLPRSVPPELIALSTLLLFGPLYTLASPQAKFVSGGVIGNVFGNFFIPLILLIFLRAFREKNSRLLGLGFVIVYTLAYTHHLSTLMLLYTLVGSIGLLIISHLGHTASLLRDIRTTLFRREPLVIALLAFCFFFFVAMPTYIETHAVGTALGTPTKLTRIGLSFHQITEVAGPARFALGLLGICLVLTMFRQSFAASLLLGWALMLFLMSYRPDWLFLNIPSNRIGTYFSFPMGILASFGLAWIITITRKNIRNPLTLLLLTTTLVFTFASGFSDNGQSLLVAPQSKGALETFSVSEYLAKSLQQHDVVLKDHNYLTADTWMKHFFMRDYFFPLSRGYFGRYENPTHEHCTLDMIAIPNTPRAQACFTGTGVNYVIVNPHFDAPQFEKSPQFSRVYVSDSIHVYAR